MYAPEETGGGLTKTVWKTGLHACALGLVVLVLWRAAGFLRLAAISVIVAAALESPRPTTATLSGWPALARSEK